MDFFKCLVNGNSKILDTNKNTLYIIRSLCICLPQRINHYFATRGFARGWKSTRTNQSAAISPDWDVGYLKIPARRSQELHVTAREKAKALIPCNIDTRTSRTGRMSRDTEGFNSHVSSTRISGEITSGIAAHIARYSGIRRNRP